MRDTYIMVCPIDGHGTTTQQVTHKNAAPAMFCEACLRVEMREARLELEAMRHLSPMSGRKGEE